MNSQSFREPRFLHSVVKEIFVLRPLVEAVRHVIVN